MEKAVARTAEPALHRPRASPLNKNVWTPGLNCYHSARPFHSAVVSWRLCRCSRPDMFRPISRQGRSTMSAFRNSVRFLFFTLVLALPLSAYAANYDIKVFFDTDTNRATGCNVSTANGPVAGVEQVLPTSISVNGGTGTVTGVTRQVCSGGVFGAPIPVDG